MTKVTSHPYNFQMIRADGIKINRLYQRPLDSKRIKRIASKFDWHLVNPVKVVWHKGEWVAVDGQHTLMVLRYLFGDDYMVPCFVYEDIADWFEQAKVFVKINDRNMRKVLGIRDEWHALLFANDEKATEIKKICERYNLKIPTEKGETGNGWVSAVSALEKIYNTMSKQQFDQFLYILTAAWGGKKDSLVAPMLNGLSRFITVYDGEYNRAALISRLKKTEPVVIIRAGKASAAQGHTKYAREILNVYNKGTSANRLADKLG